MSLTSRTIKVKIVLLLHGGWIASESMARLHSAQQRSLSLLCALLFV